MGGVGVMIQMRYILRRTFRGGAIWTLLNLMPVSQFLRILCCFSRAYTEEQHTSRSNLNRGKKKQNFNTNLQETAFIDNNHNKWIIPEHLRREHVERNIGMCSSTNFLPRFLCPSFLYFSQAVNHVQNLGPQFLTIWKLQSNDLNS